MLLELRIRNLAVIRELSLELAPGLNVLTGETGAGKSIVVGALGLLLGARASAESVRTGADRANIEGVFDLGDREEVADLLAGLGVEGDGEGLLLLRREIQAEGRSRAWINGSAATVGMLAEIGRALVDFHGQHEHQSLLLAGEQRRILDAFSGAGDCAEEVARRHEELSDLRRTLDLRKARLQEVAARSEFLRFQLAEIEEAGVEPGEDDRIVEELGRLEHSEELARGANTVHEVLYSGEGAVSEQVAQVRDLLARLGRFDDSLTPLGLQIEEVYHRVVELGRALEGYAARVDVSPDRAEELRARADLLFRLKRKYGPGLPEVIAARDRLRRELSELDGSELEGREGERRLREADASLRRETADLTRRRVAGAKRLAGEMELILPDLGMPGSRFEVALEPVDPPESGGAERIRFLASLNAGFEPRPLARIASGGELSRVMLALKSILAGEDRIPTLVFDEIDAGIGGVVAVAVGRKLAAVGEGHQVFAITHLPQIAARGANHLHVEKLEEGGVAVTRVTALDPEERIREVARMLGGDPDSETSRAHARELLAATSASK